MQMNIDIIIGVFNLIFLWKKQLMFCPFVSLAPTIRHTRAFSLLHTFPMSNDGRAFVRLLRQEPDLCAKNDSICGPLNVGPTCWVNSIQQHYYVHRNLSGNNITALVSPAKDPFRASFARFRQLEHLWESICINVASIKLADCLCARRDLSGNALLQELPSLVFSANPNLYDLYESNRTCLTCHCFLYAIHL